VGEVVEFRAERLVGARRLDLRVEVDAELRRLVVLDVAHPPLVELLVVDDRPRLHDAVGLPGMVSVSCVSPDPICTSFIVMS